MILYRKLLTLAWSYMYIYITWFRLFFSTWIRIMIRIRNTWAQVHLELAMSNFWINLSDRVLLHVRSKLIVSNWSEQIIIGLLGVEKSNLRKWSGIVSLCFASQLQFSSSSPKNSEFISLKRGDELWKMSKKSSRVGTMVGQNIIMILEMLFKSIILKI